MVDEHAGAVADALQRDGYAVVEDALSADGVAAARADLERILADEQPGPETPFVTAEIPAGSALFYVGSLWHGGGANSTDTPRLGVVLHYAASWLRPVENHVLAVPPDAARHLPGRLQELLGYNIHPPFIGYVDGRHPRHLLDARP